MQTPTKTDVHKLPTAVLAADITSDAGTVYTGCMDGVYRLDLNDGEARRIAQHDSYVSSVSLIEALQQLVSGGYDGNILWTDLSANQEIRKVEAHRFWSWRSAVSPDKNYVATVTGQYLAGSYKYEPAAETEPSVRVYDAHDGRLLQNLPHVPSVQAVAISPDSRHVAAANIMGEIRAWDIESGDRVNNWTTPDFTSWGIIKSHCYIGGIFDLAFTPDGEHLLATGMGPMRDPMAGNGKQMWQKFAWREEPARKVGQFKGGEGLMESLAFHPSGKFFAMGGRLRGGNWNVAIFETASGKLVHSFKSSMRVTKLLFSSDGRQLFVAGTKGQPEGKNNLDKHFGRLEVYAVG